MTPQPTAEIREAAERLLNFDEAEWLKCHPDIEKAAKLLAVSVLSRPADDGETEVCLRCGRSIINAADETR